MKILILLFASFFGFGLAVQQTVLTNEPAEVVVIEHTEAASPELEEPVMNVMLDTLEITAVAPAAVASN